MIEKNYTNMDCFTEEDLVSYLYGETGESDRAMFEQHLTDCSVCIDEFASLSDSRFSIYQWQKVDFARLATPEITGPWQEQAIRKVKSAETIESASWLQVLLMVFRRPAFAVITIIPLLMAAVAIGIYLSRSLNSSSVADRTEPAVVQAPSEPAVQTAPAQIADLSPEPREEHIVASETDRTKPEVRYARAVKTSPARQSIKTEVASTNISPRVSNRRPPRLSDFEEEDENGVRLADLLAETDRDKF